MQDAVVVVLSYDSSTFRQKHELMGSLCKDVDVLAKFFNEASQRTETHFLSCNFVGSETAEDLVGLLERTWGEYGINVEKIIQLSWDNPAVNKRAAKDLELKLKDLTGDQQLLLDFGASPLHPANTSIGKGLLILNIPIDLISVSLHSFFKNLPARCEKYGKFCAMLGEDIEFWHKHVSTCWNTIKEPSKKLLKNFDVIGMFILEELQKIDKKCKAGAVYKNFFNLKRGNQTWPNYLIWLNYAG